MHNTFRKVGTHPTLLTVVALTLACSGRGGDDEAGGDGGNDPFDSWGNTESASEAGGSDSRGSGDGERFDVGEGESGGGVGGDCNGPGGSGDFDFSYIWIANSPEGTVSKINTFTGEEEGRYLTGPDSPDPSRTSVNQFGDVAVANRGGSVTKILARAEDCPDQNGDGQITTSSGANDVLDWGEDECMVWHVEVPSNANDVGPRPIAWEPVPSNECTTRMPRLWFGWYEPGGDTGIFLRLDGATGAELDRVEIQDWDYGRNPRPYGGAVNIDGDFWVTGYYGPAIRIDAETLDVDYVAPPDGAGFYGMTLDATGNLWIGGCDGAIYHYDVPRESMEMVSPVQGRARGVMVDREGRAWFAGNNPCRLILADTTTKSLVDENIELPGCSDPVGVSIDVEGYVWVVDRGADQAYKVDPDSHDVVLTVGGLIAPYTYSDMTGAGLGLVSNPPAG